MRFYRYSYMRFGGACNPRFTGHENGPPEAVVTLGALHRAWPSILMREYPALNSTDDIDREPGIGIVTQG